MIFETHPLALSKNEVPPFPDETSVFSPMSSTIIVASYIKKKVQVKVTDQIYLFTNKNKAFHNILQISELTFLPAISPNFTVF
jgi:hypothetical protein